MSKQASFSKFLAGIGLASVAATQPASSPAPSSADPENEDQSAGDDTVPADEAQAAVTAALAKGKTEGEAIGFKAAQDRMVAVMSSEAGKKQPGAAVELMARAPSMSADDVIATLDKIAPAQAAEAPKGGAAAVGADLNQTPKPNAGAAPQEGGANDGVDAVSLWDSVQGTKQGKPVAAAA